MTCAICGCALTGMPHPCAKEHSEHCCACWTESLAGNATIVREHQHWLARHAERHSSTLTRCPRAVPGSGAGDGPALAAYRAHVQRVREDET